MTVVPRIGLLLSALLPAACVPDRPVRTSVDALIAEAPCATDVRALVASWEGGPGYLTGPSVRGGQRAYRIPAGPIGRWVVLDPAADGSVLVSRWDDGFAEAVLFEPRTCVAAEPADQQGGVEVAASERQAGEPSTQRPDNSGAGSRSPAPRGFTDADLRAALRDVSSGGPSGADGPRVDALVVYAWSPHMPLSVDGYEEVESAAASMNLRVVPVLIAGGNPDFARREAERVGIPEDGLREVASVELWMRDAQVHAPSVLVFGGSRISPVLPGYRNAAGYRRYLASFLGRRP